MSGGGSRGCAGVIGRSARRLKGWGGWGCDGVGRGTRAPGPEPRDHRWLAEVAEVSRRSLRSLLDHHESPSPLVEVRGPPGPSLETTVVAAEVSRRSLRSLLDHRERRSLRSLLDHRESPSPLVEVRGPPGPSLETTEGSPGRRPGLETLAALAPRPPGELAALAPRPPVSHRRRWSRCEGPRARASRPPRADAEVSRPPRGRGQRRAVSWTASRARRVIARIARMGPAPPSIGTSRRSRSSVSSCVSSGPDRGCGRQARGERQA